MLPSLGATPHPPSNIGNISGNYERIPTKFSANFSTHYDNYYYIKIF